MQQTDDEKPQPNNTIFEQVTSAIRGVGVVRNCTKCSLSNMTTIGVSSEEKLCSGISDEGQRHVYALGLRVLLSVHLAPCVVTPAPGKQHLSFSVDHLRAVVASGFRILAATAWNRDARQLWRCCWSIEQCVGSQELALRNKGGAPGGDFGVGRFCVGESRRLNIMAFAWSADWESCRRVCIQVSHTVCEGLSAAPSQRDRGSIAVHVLGCFCFRCTGNPGSRRGLPVQMVL